MFSHHSRQPSVPSTSYTLRRAKLSDGSYETLQKPKTFMTLNELWSRDRFLPAYDVLPARLIKPDAYSNLQQASHIYRLSHGFGPDDIAVIPSDDSKTQAVYKELRDLRREYVMPGAICQVLAGENNNTYTKTETELCLWNGTVWLAERRSADRYVFTRQDNRVDVTRGTAAYIDQVRWVRDKHVEASGLQKFRRAHPPQFSFSPRFTGHKGHPRMARISEERLMIQHSHKMPPDSGESARKLDEGLQALIVVSGIWVALMEGWSPVAGRNDDGNAIRDYRKDSVVTSEFSRQRTRLQNDPSGRTSRITSLAPINTSDSISIGTTPTDHPGCLLHMNGFDRNCEPCTRFTLRGGNFEQSPTSVLEEPDSYEDRQLDSIEVNRRRARKLLYEWQTVVSPNGSFVSGYTVSDDVEPEDEDAGHTIGGGDGTHDQDILQGTARMPWRKRTLEKMKKLFRKRPWKRQDHSNI